MVKNQSVKQRVQRTPGDLWQWEANGQCSKGDNCSLRQDINKRAKTTQRIFLRALLRSRLKNAPGTKSPRGRSPSGKMTRLPCKDYLKGICTTPFCAKFHPPECLFTSRRMDADLVKSALMRIARLKNSLARSLERMVTKLQWLYWRIHDNWVAYFKIRSRRSLHRFYGRAQTYGNQSDVFNSQKLSYVMRTFEIKIHRLEWFGQVILISVTPMLQTLRIGLRKRRKGKSDVPVKQRGGWPKVS